MIGLLTLHLLIPGCTSLKEKRHRLKPLLSRLHREFNVSVAELDRQDAWQEAIIGCAILSNDSAHTQRSLQSILRWVEHEWPDVQVVGDHLEIL